MKLLTKCLFCKYCYHCTTIFHVITSGDCADWVNARHYMYMYIWLEHDHRPIATGN